MTKIIVPPAALEAGAKAVFRTGFDRDPCDDPFDNDRLAFARKYARAAFEAMVAAWPGAAVCHYTIGDDEGYEMVLPIPFPQEGGDEQA